MRLSTFIIQHMGSILQTWEDFARTVQIPREALSDTGLRNHVAFILKTVARDMETPQSLQQEVDKRRGLGPTLVGESTNETYAVLRVLNVFTLDQMVYEYRALRSSVLRLWLSQETSLDQADQVREIIRFNEVLDQTLVESIASYRRAVDSTRKMVLGALGHDLRSPLTAIKMGADMLTKTKQWRTREQALAVQIGDSAERANQLVNELLDLARCNLGLGIPVRRQDTDLTSLCATVINEVCVSQPQINVVFERTNALHASIDPLRMSQVISNLTVNAIRHGDVERPIRISLSCAENLAVIEVHNWGNPISAEQINYLFDPEARLTRASCADGKQRQGLGLGLFIAKEITASHAGSIDVISSPEHGTTFRVSFPRQPTT
ncbi:HAMP domain-containing histidine kinase [Pseudomonas sp. V1]|uniref:sensor histidine kinase n=1 Tax=Pseudomonas arcuscaelestis TaxID=2710591 RepID=UPI00193FE543|nr:HAMP domain-containing sensor histidine kinase [Pseudomonas arcuscaelestis]MBM3106205.1 HAMP domain-containing histidine kinase [Pseudomonas arcuscaelestis]